MLVLDYGTPETLQILKERADDLAAVMVEPVQSRRPDFQPREFLHEVRGLTERSGSALIFDEVITGFRMHPGGAQAHFGVRADLATYGKVIGGGMPIGVIAGKSKFMDALDGGMWQFGDDSFPEVGVTYFAGTFVRHPLALAAAKAVLEHLKQQGPGLQQALNEKTRKFADELNAYFASVEAPFSIAYFGSLFKVMYPQEMTYGELMFYHLREKGIHIWDHRPCFLTTAHTDADVDFAVNAFKESIVEMQEGGFLHNPAKTASVTPQAKTIKASVNKKHRAIPDKPPVPGARLGKDPEGNPAWFVPDPEREGKYLQVSSST